MEAAIKNGELGFQVEPGKTKCGKSFLRQRDFDNQLIILTLIVFLLIVFVSGCDKKGPSLPKIKIAILQDQPQEWADAMKSGFTDGLFEQGIEVGTKVEIVSRSAAGDSQGLSAIADSFVQGDYVLIYSIGTQSTAEVFRGTKTKPIIFGAVTDPVRAGFFKADLNHPLGNITGTQGLWPYSAQFDVMRILLPKLKKVGIVYNLDEPNSMVSVKYIRAECRKRNIRLAERTVTAASQIETAVNAVLNERIDLFFIPADNAVLAASRVVIALCHRKKIPVFTGVCEIAGNGALATVGVNYYQLGQINAKQAAEILLNGKQAREIPVVVADKGDICVNLRTAKNLGISIPKEIEERAHKIYQYQ